MGKPESQVHECKQHWVKQMRLKFCVRPDDEITKELINADGTLNQKYFHPPEGWQPGKPKCPWTDNERALLVQGIEKYGIGHFREIQEEFLPDWVTYLIFRPPFALVL
ncbi:6512_t:CDS:2 [Paraglomus brasilianum]|uniref:6512_t:CDS:1 n=1 Tax=Paraglomus brasilianum TaxID=144538 RepID=A0A9N9FIN1_9GLOM|nr:6512_t:CDS:2 [Paraglomus brasilianum]